MKKVIMHAMLSVLVCMGLPVLCRGMEEVITLAAIDNGSDRATNETEIPLLSTLSKKKVQVPLKWLRYSETLEHLLQDTGITITTEGQRRVIVPFSVLNVSVQTLDFIFNTVVPRIANNSLNIEQLCAARDIYFVLDTIIAVNYLDIQHELLSKLIRYCAQRVMYDPQKNNIKDRIKDIPPVLLRMIFKEWVPEKLYPVTERQPVAICKQHEGHITSVCAITTKEGAVLVISGSYDKTVRICDIKGKQIGICKGHTAEVDAVYAIRAKNGEVYIISGSWDNTVRIWDTQGNELATCRGHTGKITSVWAIEAKNGEVYIISGSWDNTVRIWDTQGNELAICKGHEEPIFSVCAVQEEDIRIISESGDRTIRIWNCAGDELKVLRPKETITAVYAINTKDGIRIIFAAIDKTVRIWDAQGNELKILKGHTGSIYTMYAIEMRDGWRIIFGSDDKKVHAWDMQGNAIATCVGHVSPINALYALKKEEEIYIISGSDAPEKSVCIWDVLSFIEKCNCINKIQAEKIYDDLFIENQNNKETLYKKIKKVFEERSKKQEPLPQPEPESELDEKLQLLTAKLNVLEKALK